MCVCVCVYVWVGGWVGVCVAQKHPSISVADYCCVHLFLQLDFGEAGCDLDIIHITQRAVHAQQRLFVAMRLRDESDFSAAVPVTANTAFECELKLAATQCVRFVKVFAQAADELMPVLLQLEKVIVLRACTAADTRYCSCFYYCD